MKTSLRVLVTNFTLAGHRGARTVTRDLVTGLIRAGHRPAVYSTHPGAFADELRSLSVPVTDDITTITEAPDIIHAQHLPVTTVALLRFPATPAIFVCHDFLAWQDTPPRLPQIRRYAAISDAFRERLVIEGGVPAEHARVILNAVDTERYELAQPPARRPQRALAFAKNVGHLDAIRELCRAEGIALEEAGGAVKRVISPADAFPGVDLVFASALTAMEAMATGRAVMVCDGRGLAGMATTARFSDWRRENFGLRTLIQPVTAKNLATELKLYDADDAFAVGQRLRREAGVEDWISQFVGLYREAISDMAERRTSDEATAIAWSAHLQGWLGQDGPGFPWLTERKRLLGEIRLLEGRVARGPGQDPDQ